MNKLISILALLISPIIFARPSIEAGKAKSAVCASCHGVSGNSVVSSFPKLANQNAEYFIKQMQNFKSGARKDPIMQAQVLSLSQQDIENLAHYFASLPISDGYANKKLVQKGERLYRGGNKAKQITACVACHGAQGNGNRSARYPKISGQHATYTAKQLTSFKNKTRTNDKNQMMQDIAKHLSNDEIKAVSSYIEGLH